VLDIRNIGTFWITTGLYPQELHLSFDRPQEVKEVRFQATGAKKIEILGCSDKQGSAGSFQKLGESKELSQRSGL